MPSVWDLTPNPVKYSFLEDFPYFRKEQNRAPTFLLYAIEEGAVEIQPEGEKTVRLEKGDALFLSPNVTFRQTILSPASLHIVRFSLGDNDFLLPLLQIRISDLPVLAQDLFELKNLLSQKTLSIGHYREHLICDVWYQLANTMQDPGVRYRTQPGDRFFLEIDNYISANPGVTVTELAKHFSVSRAGLNKIFRKNCQKSVGSRITERRMESARVNLTSLNLPLKQIAPLCGYSNEYYFSSVFKAYHGKTPNTYRNEFAKKSKE